MGTSTGRGSPARESLPAAPVDLRAPEGDPWGELVVPDGWEAIAELATRVADGLDELAADIVRCIGEELPEYASAVPDDDLHASVHRTIEMMLVGIAENRRPRPEEISIRRELGHRRAQQGLPVSSLVRAYHVGYRELWQALVRALPPGSPEVATALLTVATTVWGWVHETTDAISEAHRETMRARESHVIGARQRFTELLVAGDLDAEEVPRLAASIGFDVGGSFRVVTGTVPAVDGSEPRRVQAALESLPGVHAVVARGPRIIVTTQGVDEDALVPVLPRALPHATFGVGLERAGLAGARESLGDADRALELAEPGGVARFEDEWLWATLLRVAPRLADVVAEGTATAAQHPHLAETVLVFADAGFSVSETARQLSLHANTVAYRLERWHALTGWDPRTFAGLTRSLASLRLASE